MAYFPWCCHLVNWMKPAFSLILAHSLHCVKTMSYLKQDRIAIRGLSHGNTCTEN